MLKISNTLSRKKEVFKPQIEGKVSLFVCGPTVYDFSHVGHARTYIAFDIVAKYLKAQGYDVFYLQNITDLDDKIIQRAKESGLAPLQLSTKFEEEYLKDMKALGVDSVTKYARATDHIPETISQIERLMEKGYAYEIQGDGIYYDIAKFTRYGKLSGRTSLLAEDAVSRIDESISKKNKGDFALWKFSNEGFAPTWDSPWGKGRPGWHIEDTAITEKYFGSQYDIHGGAQDLVFPHHEAEISQMEAISGKRPLASYWMHTGFLTVHGEKMSKSLGNFVTIQDFITTYSERILRFFFLKTHYRSPMDYSDALVKQAQAELERIDEFVDRVKESEGTASSASLVSPYAEKFEEAMEDDFNTPKAMAAIFEFIRKVNPLLEKNQIGSEEKEEILSFLRKVDELFGFIFWRTQTKVQVIPQDIEDLVSQRESFRKEGRWDKADEVRKQLEKEGWITEDTPQGPRVKPQRK
ncbi:MAG: cysteine--tRNA ligase [bacterium]|nr:cysteine--tRNA ligase [bacterium]